MAVEKVSLVIFTCEGREYLLHDTYNSFKKACDYPFAKTILAIDGKVNSSIVDHVQPDMVVQSPVRKGYINNILQALSGIDTPYFFWLEDDWKFNADVKLAPFIDLLNTNSHWLQIMYSKFGPLQADMKEQPLSGDLYKTPFGFSANPCICKTAFIREGFEHLLNAPKGDKLGEDGFENFLTRHFTQAGLISVIQDPVDHIIISHEGYLESTPRNWHMTNSIDHKTEEHLLTLPAPSAGRKLLMALKLIALFPKLAVKQLSDNQVYELCFRILASARSLKKK